MIQRKGLITVYGTVVLLTLIGGCLLLPIGYQGDGAFRIRLLHSAYERYLLSLGTFKSDKPGSWTFEIGKLPPHRFIWNIRIDEKQYDDLQNPGFRSGDIPILNLAVVELTITDARTGRIVASKKDSLSHWRWIGIRSIGPPIQNSNGSIEGRVILSEIMITSDEFDFVVEKGNHYSVTFSILEPDSYGWTLSLEAVGGPDALVSFLP